MYCIKEGYKCGRGYFYCDSEWNAANYQIPVYTFASKVILEKGLISTLDIGCGRGTKLLKYIYPICNDMEGIDIKAFNMWLTDDIEKPTLVPKRKFELIICSDVVEHLVDPDKLFPYIKKFSNPETFIVISTPERDAVRGKGHFGPPPNGSHVREWNKNEFENYIQGKGLKILKSFMAKDLLNGKIGCQLHLVRWKNE